ncbi:NADH:flavin oxidoreductase [Hoeflea sp. IMCC20628]|uniref:NADH:flavin oxidoreductase/NADH oxidase family protein n=1 Tax=Hoeflea sp. IMCC20628 TaxID=1620421 RepID=UPI00063ABA55|nr:NADH:flavin oxidoreductase/NADH oxidase family protein [Hoeflea sp. IMCC20628]AKI00843.1 NADH:flavin oxidoreductase [Hoeflea sp. IMCC20628]
MALPRDSLLFQPLELPCGTVLKNRIVKSAMSDSLGDGRGNPTEAQFRLYERWAEGGVAVSIIGEVQGDPHFAEKPGNLVLDASSDAATFKALAQRGSANGTGLWLQLGQAGAMAHPPISTPKGPSALDLPGLTCAALTLDEVRSLPAEFARTASLAKNLGFGGVQIHAAHGFLLSQFLSPLFNHRDDDYGGSIANRMRLLLESIDAVRSAVGPLFPLAVKLNSSDQLQGGLEAEDALKVVAALDQTGIDLIDISGGTYFPGARSASDSAGGGPYFVDFARRARPLTKIPLMVTGGFKTLQQATDAVSEGIADVIGLARALALDPALPDNWQAGKSGDPAFPRFTTSPEGGITAWYSMRLTELGEDRETAEIPELEKAIREYDLRDNKRAALWNARFSG